MISQALRVNLSMETHQNNERRRNEDGPSGEQTTFVSGHRTCSFYCSYLHHLIPIVRALKLRYMIPLVSTNPSKNGKNTPLNGSTPLSSPSPSTQRFPEAVIVFDAPIVARQESGWEDMLEAVLLKWVEAVSEERRGDR